MTLLREQGDWRKGTVIRLDHQSLVLRNNPWSDPTDRAVHVYLPPGYSENADPYIALWDLAAFTNSGAGHLNWRNHGENLPDRLDRLIGQGLMPAVVVVLPDCYTSLGGNQYVNSPALGHYADYLVKELVPFVSAHVNVLHQRQGRGLFGKSSGGFGALYLAMQFSDTWGAAASHAGDVGFELVYRPAFAETCAVLADYGGDTLAFVRAFWKKNKPSARDFTTIMILAMAASYDPDLENPRHIRLPFDLRTCTLDQERWQCWLAFDPLNQVVEKTDALSKLHGLYIDVGSYDQYHIQFGSRALTDKLRQLNVNFHYQEFDGSHSAIAWRLDHSLPYLAKVLKKAVSTSR
jgi:enterochelin esterase-like enzyme